MRPSWADEIRDRPATGAWHYVDIPLRAARLSTRGATAPTAIAWWRRSKMTCASLPIRQLRADAAGPRRLRFLIHFVADVHQPLHAEDNDDKGGNEVHAFAWDASAPACTSCGTWMWSNRWDSIPTPSRTSIERDLSRRSAPGLATGHAGGTGPMKPMRLRASRSIRRWRGARDLRLPRDYACREAPLARMQLAKAGRAAGLAAQHRSLK